MMTVGTMLYVLTRFNFKHACTVMIIYIKGYTTVILDILRLKMEANVYFWIQNGASNNLEITFRYLGKCMLCYPYRLVGYKTEKSLILIDAEKNYLLMVFNILELILYY